MMKDSMLVLVVLSAAVVIEAMTPLRTFFPPAPPFSTTDDNPGEPLFLTPLIEAGELAEARQRSQVTGLDTDVESYSGYFTVNKEHDSNLFFWFFPAKANRKSAPFVLWLQGGPGGSSLFGLFVENGPFSLSSKMKLIPRSTAWSLTHSMIYIDNPVGTGFSFTGDVGGYAQNETVVGHDLYEALIQFFTVFPEYSHLPFYATGESYAGKYVPAISHTILENNPNAKIKINFNGMAIGDGLCDPITMLDYGDFLYGVGLIDELSLPLFYEKEALARQYIQEKKYIMAYKVFDALVNADDSPYGSLFWNLTGLDFYYNYLLERAPADFGYYPTFVTQASVRRAIHVGNLTHNDGTAVETALLGDIMRSVKPWIVDILNRGYRVMVYNGQLDIIIAYPLTENFVNSMDWKHAAEFKNATRHIWRVADNVAGYVKEAQNFLQVMVRDAGHILPYDQPKWAFDMINRFTMSKSFFYN